MLQTSACVEDYAGDAGKVQERRNCRYGKAVENMDKAEMTRLFEKYIKKLTGLGCAAGICRRSFMAKDR